MGFIAGQKLVGSDFGAWTSYTPAWTGATTNPVLGNGTMVGSYMPIGKTIHLKGKIIMGTTTTFGSGTWFISLPVTAVDIVGSGAVTIFDASLATNKQGGSCNLASFTTIQFWPGTGNGPVTNTVPMTWAAADLLIWSFTYEAA